MPRWRNAEFGGILRQMARSHRCGTVRSAAWGAATSTPPVELVAWEYGAATLLGRRSADRLEDTRDIAPVLADG
jgi:hypothetical protein